MKIIVNTTDENYIRMYLTLWRSTFKFTDSELRVLEVILRRYLQLREEGVKEDYIPDLLFNSQARSELRESVGFSQQYFNNVVKLLKDKRVITPVRDTYYISDRRVIPVAELTFKFIKQ